MRRPQTHIVNQTPYLRRLARFVVVQAVFDYAKARKTIADPSATALELLKAEGRVAEIETMFDPEFGDPWVEASGFDRKLICERFARFRSNPDAIDAAATRRWFPDLENE